MIRLPVLSDGLWTALCDLADAMGPNDWTLIGGQMVLLHALENDRTIPRVSDDLDGAEREAIARLLSPASVARGWMRPSEEGASGGTTIVTGRLVTLEAAIARRRHPGTQVDGDWRDHDRCAIRADQSPT